MQHKRRKKNKTLYMNILLSDTNCKFLNNIKYVLSQTNKYNIYETNKRNIFNVYDHTHPDVIFLSETDQTHTDIINFLNTWDQKSKIVIESFHNNLLVNDKIYTNQNQLNRLNKVAIFLDNLKTIPKNLEKILYPHMINPIHMFNNSNIRHPQNLGILSNEFEKNEILNNYKICISWNNLYKSESHLCGCSHIDGESENLLEEIKNNLENNIINNKDYTYMTYEKFLKDIL
jgi:hypothetical protein